MIDGNGINYQRINLITSNCIFLLHKIDSIVLRIKTRLSFEPIFKLEFTHKIEK